MTETVPSCPPRMASVQKTAKVCKVNGTVVGMEIHEQTAIIAAKSPQSIILYTELPFLYLCLNLISIKFMCINPFGYNIAHFMDIVNHTICISWQFCGVKWRRFLSCFNICKIFISVFWFLYFKQKSLLTILHKKPEDLLWNFSFLTVYRSCCFAV